MANLLWLQGGACSGNTASFLNSEEPSVCDLGTRCGIRVPWNPSLGLEPGDDILVFKWCDLPELAVPVEPDWYCKPWRI